MTHLTIREMPSEERPRERLTRLGGSALKISELLAILLRTGLKGKSALQVGEEIFTKFGSLEKLSRASVAELARVKGVGPAKAVQLAAAFALGARLSRSMAEARPMETAAQVYELLGEEMRLLNYESLRVILLNTKLILLGVEEVTRGILNQSLFHPREIFRPAITRSAYALILVHNHPSGDPQPSAEDIRATSQLRQAADLMQLRLFDHIIVGAPRTNQDAAYFSFRENGLI